MNRTSRCSGWWLSVLLVVWSIGAPAGSLPVVADEGAKLTGLLHNEDCTDFFYNAEIPAGKAGEVVDRYVDVLADAGVSVLMFNTNARRTNYRSDVWEAFWDGYEPQGPDDQPFPSTTSQASFTATRPWTTVTGC